MSTLPAAAPQITSSKLWWLWLPLLLLPVQAVVELAFPAHSLAALHSEGGPHETLQTIILVTAFIFAAKTLIVMKPKDRPWLALWVGFAALCIFYVTGEEVSWGQHLFGWVTPDGWAEINDQQETNFHNTSSWLDQKPRLLLEIGVLVGGIVMPLLRRFAPGALPARFAAIYPPDHVWVTAVCMAGCKFGDALAESMGFNIFERVSEIVELYLYWFVLLYILHIYKAVRPARAAS